MVMLRRLLSTAIVLAAAFLTTSCAPEWTRPAQNGSWNRPITAYVCVSLPKEQQAAAKLAIDGWDHALGQWKHVVYVESPGPVGPDCTYWVHEVTDEGISEDDKHALAWASMLGGSEISMRKGWYEHDTTGILLHELGHAFGAQHVPGTLMNATYWRHGFVCPDATTVAQVAAFNKVNLALLCWCYY